MIAGRRAGKGQSVSGRVSVVRHGRRSVRRCRPLRPRGRPRAGRPPPARPRLAPPGHSASAVRRIGFAARKAFTGKRNRSHRKVVGCARLSMPATTLRPAMRLGSASETFTPSNDEGKCMAVSRHAVAGLLGDEPAAVRPGDPVCEQSRCRVRGPERAQQVDRPVEQRVAPEAHHQRPPAQRLPGGPLDHRVRAAFAQPGEEGAMRGGGRKRLVPRCRRSPPGRAPERNSAVPRGT